MKKWLCLLLCAALLLPAAALGEPKQLSSLSEKPAVNGDGFLNAGEQAAYYKNHAEGVWFYVDEDVRIEITRSQTKKPLLTWYIAEIHCRRGTTMYTVPWNEKRFGTGAGGLSHARADGGILRRKRQGQCHERGLGANLR